MSKRYATTKNDKSAKPLKQFNCRLPATTMDIILAAARQQNCSQAAVIVAWADHLRSWLPPTP